MNIYKNIWKLCLAHTASAPDTLGGNCTIFNEAGDGREEGGGGCFGSQIPVSLPGCQDSQGQIITERKFRQDKLGLSTRKPVIKRHKKENGV